MMSKSFVIDTNSLISAVLIEGTSSSRALDKAILLGKLIFSQSTADEFIEVLFRKKLDKYFVNDDERWESIECILSHSFLLSPVETITVCRDPKDNKFLELAVAAEASCSISGDKDLLELHSFRGIPIVNAVEFLSMVF